jgi:hypothetical protein
MNLRDALRAARDLGCCIRQINRTGEIIVSHPSVDRRIVVNSRRKDAPRELTALLLAVQGFELVPVPSPPRAPIGPQTRAQRAANAGSRGGSRPRKRR